MALTGGGVERIITRQNSFITAVGFPIMRNASKRIAFHSVAVLILLCSAPSAAQLVKKADPSRAGEQKGDRAIDRLVKAVNSAYDTDLKAADVVDGVPAALVEVVRAFYGDQTLKAADKLKAFGAAGKRFDERWAEYTAKKAKVDEILKKVKKLKSSGFETDARDVLINAVSPVEREDDGTISRNRQFLESSDAEMALLTELGHLLEGLKEYGTLFEVAAAMDGRRKVFSVEEERLLWIAAEHDLLKFADGARAPVSDAIGFIVDSVSKTREMGGLLSYGLWQKLNGGMLKRLQPADPDTAQIDDWVIVNLTPDRVDESGASWFKDGSFDVERDCYATSRIVGIDYWTGRVYYQVACRKVHVTVNIRVNVEFATPPDSWARKGNVFIVGRVTGKSRTNGVQWKIEDAFIPDVRFINR